MSPKSVFPCAICLLGVVLLIKEFQELEWSYRLASDAGLPGACVKIGLSMAVIGVGILFAAWDLVKQVLGLKKRAGRCEDVEP
jgi:hypothetical protein